MRQHQIDALEATLQKDHGNVAGLVVLRNGATVYEGYYGGSAAHCPVHVFSVTKSIISLLFGIAIGRGCIEGVEQLVLDFFPEYVPKRGEKTLQHITIRHLLTMTAPYKYRSAPYTKYFTSEDWVKAALDLLGGRSAPGTFRYTPLIGPDILSGILARACGQPVLGFANEHLFGPLGFQVGGSVHFESAEEQFAFLKAKDTGGWVCDPVGTHTAGWGLCLRAMDMARIGQLCLDGGVWQGRQVVPAGWIAESLRKHSHWPQMNLPYGYLWWPQIGNGFAAMGDSGNVLYANPTLRLVVAITAFYKPSAKDRIGLIADTIEPLFGSSAAGR